MNRVPNLATISPDRRIGHTAIAPEAIQLQAQTVGKKLVVFLMTGFLIVTAAGCGQSGPAVQYVEGRVLLDGAPVSGATVNFQPLTPEAMPAYGGTDAEGIYRLTTTRGGRRDGGALAGDYAITISKWRNRLEDLPAEPDPSDTTALSEWMRKKEALERLPPDYIVPKRYGDPKTSCLTASVKQGRNTGEAFVFELSSESQN